MKSKLLHKLLVKLNTRKGLWQYLDRWIICWCYFASSVLGILSLGLYFNTEWAVDYVMVRTWAGIQDMKQQQEKASRG